MSPSLKPWIVSTCAALMLAIGTPHASALQRAPSQGTAAINARATTIPAALRSQYFQTPDGEPGVAVGGGAWQYYRGNAGDGAIYWSARTGAHLIYGPYLDFFARNGEERRFGFPIGEPVRGREGRCGSDAYAYQRFEKTANVGGVGGGQLVVTGTVLCQRSEDPETGVYEGVTFN